MKIPVTNNTKMPIYVGAYMVPAGETRHFEEHEVPEHLQPVPATPAEPEPAVDPLQDLVAQSTAEQVIAALPGLSTEDLERLGDIEQARTRDHKPAPRKSVLSAIAETLLERAEAGDRSTE
jgi:hypothetical protein